MSDLIIIDIQENERTILDGQLNQKEIKGNGKISIKNPSQKSRLWNLGCDLKEIVNTTISSRELDVGILNPNKEYTSEYEVQNLKEPSLKVVDIFDTTTSISDKVNNTFLFETENKCKLKLVLTNPLDIPISNIKVKRVLPSFFQKIEISNPNIGVAGIIEESELRFLSWDIVSLAGQQRAELELTCTVNLKDSDVKALGTLDVTYLINNYKLTMINPEVRGLTDSMSGIDRDEGSQPGMWDCSVEFINESEFQVRIENVKVSQKITTGIENVVSQAPNRLLNPEQSWDFDFQVESKDVPELSSSIEFTPLFVVLTRVVGEINKESSVYPVLRASINKSMNPPEVDAYANTDMVIENVIVNNGTSIIGAINIIDEIPQDFVPPLINQVKVTLGNIDISSRTNFTKKLELAPSDQSPDSKHQILIELFNLSNEFIQDAKLIVSYPLKARNPRPPTETLYKTPVKIEVNSPVEGNLFIKSPDIEPEIKVKYVKRKLKTLKSIKPGMSEGEFSISVRIQNKGNVELENIIVKDKIPKGFDLTNINIDDYKVVKIGEESELQVKIAELKGNESLSLNYTCSGQGDYPRYEPEIIVQGREGSESTQTSNNQVGVPAQTVKGAITSISTEKSAIINDLFSNIFKKIDQTITGNVLSAFIEDMRDQFPPGPILHQFMQFAKDIKTDKLVVGSLRDEALAKLKEFKEKYT